MKSKAKKIIKPDDTKTKLYKRLDDPLENSKTAKNNKKKPDSRDNVSTYIYTY